MSITAMADRRINVYRRTSRVRDAAPATAVMALDRQPAVPSCIEVEISGGTDNTGTVTVSGTADGAPDSEVLTFDGVRLTRPTVKRFSALDPLTSSGLADEATVPTLVARAVGTGGERNHSRTLIASEWPARFDHGRPNWPATHPGWTGHQKTRFYVDRNSVWQPQRGDIIEDLKTGEQWKVKGDGDQHDASTVLHHHEIEVDRFESDG